MSRLYHRLRERSVAALAGYFPPAGLVVDLGCGSGALSLALCDESPARHVLAIDHDEDRIRRVEALRGDRPIETRVAAMESLDPPACMGIALIDVLHYFREYEQAALLRRAARALLPGGVLVLRDPDAAAGLRFRWNRFHERVATATGWTQATVRHYRTAEAWAALLAAEGLRSEVGPPAQGLYADRIVVGYAA